MKRSALFKLIMFSMPFLVFFLSCVALEVFLRSSFYYPGSYVRFFQPVDQLEVFSEVFADSTGIQRYNKAYLDSHETYKQMDIYANNHGFRSRPFQRREERDSSKKSILFIGDSNTWGASAEPLSKSFVDLVDSAGYIAYNTGMPGSDITQNLAIARHYIPYLKPDICIFTYNHIQYFERESTPHIPLDYWTNAGILEAWKSNLIKDAEGEYFANAEEAYNYYTHNYSLCHPEVNWIGKVCSKTVITTNIYRFLSGWKDPAQDVVFPEEPVVKNYMVQIDRVCRENDVIFMQFLVPYIADIGKTTDELEMITPGWFGEYPPMIPPNLTIDDFVVIEAHMNNQGHRKMADFMLDEIEKLDLD